MSTSPYDIFKIDEKSENEEGITAEYPVPNQPKRGFKVRFVHAGETNHHYRNYLRAILKPMNFRLQQDLVQDEEYEELLKGVFAKKIIKDWQVKDENGNWVQGIYGPTFEVLPFNELNIITVFMDAPRLFKDIRKQAENFSTFKKVINDIDAKN